jgi:hypothetical protein
MRASARPQRRLHAVLAPALAVLVAFTTYSTTGFPADERPARSVTARDDGPSASRSAERVEPEGWSGFAFDACRAPSQRTMDRWRRTSPFLGVGIYIGGPLRACPQRHLTKHWVGRQLRSGWKLLPIWVGPQASCTSYRRRIDARTGAGRRFPHAYRQGAQAARGASSAARALGIPRATTLWYDLEYFSAHRSRCRNSSLRFLSGWTEEVRRHGYRSGVYSSVSAAIRALGDARGRRHVVAPDHVWFAWENHRADANMHPYVRARRWKEHARVHQFSLDTRASYGGIAMDIDRNFVDLGRPPARRHEPARCGAAADLRGFPTLARGRSGTRVAAAQCLLRGLVPDRVAQRVAAPGSYEAGTHEAVRRFQRSRRLRGTGRLDRRTWTALLAAGPQVVLKRGSVGPPVRRLQRALNAALPGSIAVSGYFGPRTASAVRRYHHRVGLHDVVVVNDRTWDALNEGRLGPAHPKGKKHSSKAGKKHARSHPKKRHDRGHGKQAKHGKHGKRKHQGHRRR